MPCDFKLVEVREGYQAEFEHTGAGLLVHSLSTTTKMDKTLSTPRPTSYPSLGNVDPSRITNDEPLAILRLDLLGLLQGSLAVSLAQTHTVLHDSPITRELEVMANLTSHLLLRVLHLNKGFIQGPVGNLASEMDELLDRGSEERRAVPHLAFGPADDLLAGLVAVTMDHADDHLTLPALPALRVRVGRRGEVLCPDRCRLLFLPLLLFLLLDSRNFLGEDGGVELRRGGFLHHASSDSRVIEVGGWSGPGLLGAEGVQVAKGPFRAAG